MPPIDQAQKDVLRRLVPQPAGLTQPVVMRAMEALRKAYPKDMVGVRVQDNPMTHPDAFSSGLATTPMDLRQHPNFKPDMQERIGDPFQIDLNPAVSASFPQDAIEGILAHELQHIRQNRSGANVTNRLLQFRLPYEDRPDELDARAMTKKYDDSKGSNGEYSYPPDWPAALKHLQGLYTPSK